MYFCSIFKLQLCIESVRSSIVDAYVKCIVIWLPYRAYDSFLLFVQQWIFLYEYIHTFTVNGSKKWYRVKENKELDTNNCEILYALDFDKVLQTFSFHCVKAFSNKQFHIKVIHKYIFHGTEVAKRSQQEWRAHIMLFYSMQI